MFKILTKSSRHYIFSEFFSKGTTFMSILFIANFLEKDIFGLLTLYFIGFELTTIVVSNGINASARINFFEYNKLDFIRGCLYHLINSFFCATLIFFTGFLIFPKYLLAVSIISLTAFLRTIFLLNLSILQCNELSKNYLILNASYTLLYNGLLILFMIEGFGITSWLYAILIAYAIITVFCFSPQLKEYYFKSISFKFKYLKKQFKEGLIFLPQAIGFWSRAGSERYYVSVFSSLTVLGVYSFNFQLSLPIVVFTTAINFYLSPIIAKLFKKGSTNDILDLTKNYANLILIFSVVFLIFSYVISRYFFYEKYFNSFYLTIWLTIINLMYALMLLFLNPLYYMGQKRVVSNFIFIYGLFLTTINFFAVKHYEIHGLIIFNILSNSVFLFFSYKILKLYLSKQKMNLSNFISNQLKNFVPAQVLEEPYKFIYRSNKKKIKTLKNKYKNKRCFIIGNGPSLNKIDLNLLKDEFTFGVNSIFYKYDEIGFKPYFYTVEDEEVMKENKKRISTFICNYNFFPSHYKKHLSNNPNTYFFNLNRSFYEKKSKFFEIPQFSNDLSRRAYCGQSVTIINLQIAYYLGFSEIYLIGMDFSYQQRNDDVKIGNKIISGGDDLNHFHKDYFGKGKIWHDPKLHNVLKSYKFAKLKFEEDNRKIFNSTEGGKLEVFERVDFKSLF